VVQTLEPVWVDGDPIRLEQILANLVVNAAKFTPLPGTIRVGVRREGPEPNSGDHNRRHNTGQHQAQRITHRYSFHIRRLHTRNAASLRTMS